MLRPVIRHIRRTMPHPTGGYHGGRLHLLKAFGLCCIAVTLFYGGFQSAMFVCKVRAGRGLPWQESKEAFAGKTFSSTSDVEQKLEVLHQATQQQAIRQQELERQLKEQRELLLQRRPGRKSYSKRLAGGPHHQEDLGHPNGKQPRSPSEQPDEVQDREQERDQIATHARTTSGRHLRPFTEYDPDFFTAQNGQDKYMYIKHFQRRPELLGKGVFVEFGARNGLKHSNTYFFEKALGWMGVMVEADVREYPTLPVNRPNTVPVFGALTNRDGDTVDFMVSRFAGWSGFVDEYNEHRMGNSACPCAHIHVPSYRLNTILDRSAPPPSAPHPL